MPATLSKEEQELQKKAEGAATVKMIGPLVFMIVCGGQLLNQSRPILVNSIVSSSLISLARACTSPPGADNRGDCTHRRGGTPS